MEAVVIEKKKINVKSFRERVQEKELETTCLICISVLVGYYLDFPLAKKCISLSHQIGQDQYGKGFDDMYFIGFWLVAFTFLRAATMKFVFHPLAQLANIKPYGKRERFAEQSWAVSYYVTFWTVGMYIMYQGPYWFNTAYYWIDYPHILMSKQMKAYYLMQLAFWFHQVYTLHIEKRRKDHFAMLSHHIITITLIVSSYYSNFTRIGNAVLCTMDLTDIFLALAKVLKYLGLSTACDITFGLFALSWPITRHILFSMIIYATAVEPSKYLDMKWEPEKGKYFTPTTQAMYVTLFVLLNIIMFYWFAMIVKVIMRVLQGKGADDSRSDSEDEPEEEKVVVVESNTNEKPTKK